MKILILKNAGRASVGGAVGKSEIDVLFFLIGEMDGVNNGVCIV